MMSSATISCLPTTPPATTTANSIYPLALFSSFLGILSSSLDISWLKFIIPGLLLEFSRRVGIVQALCDKALDIISVRATFVHGDYSYHWVMTWLDQQTSWSRRNVDVRTTCDVDPKAIGPQTSLQYHNLRKISYLPPLAGTIFTSFNGHIVTVSRTQVQSTMWEGRQFIVSVCILTRDPNILGEFISSVQTAHLATQAQTTAIHVADTVSNGWKLATTCTKPSLDSLISEPGPVHRMIKDFREFLRSKEWYLRRSIPYRRGYLMYGPPGCGKTTTIRMLAGIFDLDVYLISLSMSGMDDTLLGELLCALPARCIATIEDIDAAFTRGVNREESDDDVETKMMPASTRRSRVTLSGLLNALDGVGAQEGRIIIATTNKYHALDSALIRPGRMDVHLEFKNASKYQARKLFTHFYLPGGKNGDSVPCADFDSIAISSALATLSSDTSMLVETKEDFKPDRDQIQELADRFGSAIPEYEFSMASLQGYLMLYKTRPLDAVENVANWVDEEYAIQTAKKNRTTQDIDDSSVPTPPLTPANARILLTVPGQDTSAEGA